MSWQTSRYVAEILTACSLIAVQKPDGTRFVIPYRTDFMVIHRAFLEKKQHSCYHAALVTSTGMTLEELGENLDVGWLRCMRIGKRIVLFVHVQVFPGHNQLQTQSSLLRRSTTCLAAPKDLGACSFCASQRHFRMQLTFSSRLKECTSFMLSGFMCVHVACYTCYCISFTWHTTLCLPCCSLLLLIAPYGCGKKLICVLTSYHSFCQEEDRESDNDRLLDAAHHYVVYNAGMRLLYLMPDVSGWFSCWRHTCLSHYMFDHGASSCVWQSIILEDEDISDVFKFTEELYKTFGIMV